MSKLILLLLIALLVYYLFTAHRRAGLPPSRKKSAQAPVIENMVACSSCGVHLPQSESLESSGRYYCCEEHRKQAQ